MQETWVLSLGWEDLLRREWQPTLVFLPGNPMDRGAWRAMVHGVAKSWTQLSDAMPAHAHAHTHTQQSDSVKHIILLFVFIFFSIVVYYRILNLVPCAI